MYVEYVYKCIKFYLQMNTVYIWSISMSKFSSMKSRLTANKGHVIAKDCCLKLATVIIMVAQQGSSIWLKESAQRKTCPSMAVNNRKWEAKTFRNAQTPKSHRTTFWTCPNNKTSSVKLLEMPKTSLWSNSLSKFTRKIGIQTRQVWSNESTTFSFIQIRHF